MSSEQPGEVSPGYGERLLAARRRVKENGPGKVREAASAPPDRETPMVSSEFTVSARVRILVGELRGVEGTILRTSGAHQLWVDPDEDRGDGPPGPRWYGDWELENLAAPGQDHRSS